MSSSSLAACCRPLPALLLFSLALTTLAASPGPAWAAPESSAARFEEALPGFKVARVLWREGRLVLEHQGQLVVLRLGDALPDQPLIQLVEIGERGAVLRQASATATGAPALVPDRLIKLEKTVEGEGFRVVVLSAAAPAERAPQMESTLDAQTLAPGDKALLPAAAEDHQAPLVPATREGGGGGGR